MKAIPNKTQPKIHPFSATNPEEVEEAITEAYLALTAEELEQMLAPHSRVSKGSAVSQAHAFATQFAVWKWVDEQNRCMGLAP